MTRPLDASRSPLAFFGAELRRARLAAGLSQEQLGRQISFSGDMVGKIETTDRAPSPAFAAGCDHVFPHLEGLFTRLLGFARRWDGGTGSPWCADWASAERDATSLRCWEPLLVPGLLQTQDYATAALAAGLGTDGDGPDEIAAARQAVLDKPDPPALWMLIDEGVLHRRVGSAQIMREQLLHLAGISRRPLVTIQVVPASAGAHPGLRGAVTIGSFLHSPDIACLRTAAGCHVVAAPEVVAKMTLHYDLIRAMALPRDDSRQLIERVAQDRWARA